MSLRPMTPVAPARNIFNFFFPFCLRLLRRKVSLSSSYVLSRQSHVESMEQNDVLAFDHANTSSCIESRYPRYTEHALSQGEVSDVPRSFEIFLFVTKSDSRCRVRKLLPGVLSQNWSGRCLIGAIDGKREKEFGGSTGQV